MINNFYAVPVCVCIWAYALPGGNMQLTKTCFQLFLVLYFHTQLNTSIINMCPQHSQVEGSRIKDYAYRGRRVIYSGAGCQSKKSTSALANSNSSASSWATVPSVGLFRNPPLNGLVLIICFSYFTHICPGRLFTFYFYTQNQQRHLHKWILNPGWSASLKYSYISTLYKGFLSLGRWFTLVIWLKPHSSWPHIVPVVLLNTFYFQESMRGKKRFIEVIYVYWSS